jgi:hypothetical protein
MHNWAVCYKILSLNSRYTYMKIGIVYMNYKKTTCRTFIVLSLNFCVCVGGGGGSSEDVFLTEVH